MAQQPTYYNGYALNINGVTRLITGYNPTEGYVTVSLCFPLNVISAGATYTITDPSTASQILLPYIDVFQVISSSTDQAYNNWYIVDETQSHDTYILSRKIVSYVAATRCATLEWPMYNFGIDHTYTLRRSLPTAAYWVRNVIQPNKIQLPAYLTYPAGYFDHKYFYNSGLVAQSQNDAGAEFPNLCPSSNNVSVDSCYFVNSYSGPPDNILTVTVVNNVPNGGNFNYGSYSYNNAHMPQTDVSNGDYTHLHDIINLTPFLQNNFQPLSYNGSVASQNETTNYEVALISLTLPNVTLATGSRIAQYDRVYVEFAPKSVSSSASRQLLYTNNPNANRAVFVCPVRDYSNPNTSLYVHLECAQMVQTVKIKPNENFHFSVFLTTGELFIPFETDNYCPFGPNLKLQISAVFSMKRL